MTGVSPGWYPDPAAPDTQRYWDGEQWLGAAIPADSPTPVGPPPTAPALPPAPAPAPPDGPPPPPPAPAPAPGQPTPQGAAIPPSTLPQYPRLPAGFPTHKPEAPSPDYTPPPPRPVQLPPGIQLAPLGSRLAARLIDIAALILLNVLVNGYFFVQFYQEVQPMANAIAEALLNGQAAPDLVISDKARRIELIMTLISIGLWFAYEVPGTANNGQTLGKRLLGIKVARLDAHAITFWQSIRRWFIVALPAIIGACGWPLAIIDYLWCTWDRPAQQCLHDKAVQTVVVLAPAKPLVPGTERKDDINAGHD